MCLPVTGDTCETVQKAIELTAVAPTSCRNITDDSLFGSTSDNCLSTSPVCLHINKSFTHCCCAVDGACKGSHIGCHRITSESTWNGVELPYHIGGGGGNYAFSNRSHAASACLNQNFRSLCTQANVTEAAQNNLQKVDCRAGFTLNANGYPKTGYWAAAPSLSFARTALVAVALNGKIYVMSGQDNLGVMLTSGEVYDPLTEVWNGITPMPDARLFPSAVALSEKIYVMGGRSSMNFLNSVVVYDPLADAWDTATTPMPFAGWRMGAAALTGKIYVTGGYDGRYGTHSFNAVYDPLAKTWDTLITDLLVPRSAHGAVALNNKIYVLGGVGSGGEGDFLKSCEVYDPLTNKWRGIAPMPDARAYLGAAALNGKIYVLGGIGDVASNSGAVYDPGTDSWSATATTIGFPRA